MRIDFMEVRKCLWKWLHPYCACLVVLAPGHVSDQVFKKFLLEYSSFTMLCYFLLCSKANQLSVHTHPLFFGFPSHLGHHRAVSGVPWVVYRFSLVSSSSEGRPCPPLLLSSTLPIKVLSPLSQCISRPSPENQNQHVPGTQWVITNEWMTHVSFMHLFLMQVFCSFYFILVLLFPIFISPSQTSHALPRH